MMTVMQAVFQEMNKIPVNDLLKEFLHQTKKHKSRRPE